MVIYPLPEWLYYIVETVSLHDYSSYAFPLLPPLYLLISPLHSVFPSSLLSLGGGYSHQYLWLCYRRSTQHLLEGRAINGIQGRAAEGQQAGGVWFSAWLSPIHPTLLAVNKQGSNTESFSLNLTELE